VPGALVYEGAVMIRTKGEAGTGGIVNAVRRVRVVLGEIRGVGSWSEEEPLNRGDAVGAPFEILKRVADNGGHRS
jgi:pyridoxal 5'-phosphate synthase pdxS subunit